MKISRKIFLTALLAGGMLTGCVRGAYTTDKKNRRILRRRHNLKS